MVKPAKTTHRPKTSAPREDGRSDVIHAIGEIPRAAELRLEAETRLSEHPVFTVIHPDTDSHKLLHELQVHQTELELQNEALLENRALAEAAAERFALALDAADTGLWDWDIDRHTLDLSPRCFDILGMPREAATGSRATTSAAHTGELFRVLGTLQSRLQDGSDKDSMEFRAPGRSRRNIAWVRCAGRVAARGPNGEPLRIVGTMIDITAHKQAEDQFRIAAVAFESGDAMVVTDPHGVILQVNGAFTEVTGYSAAEAIGNTSALLKSGRHGNDFYRTLWEAIAREGRWEGKIWNRRKDGGVFPEWLSIAAVRDKSGATTHYLGTFSDISDPREREQKIVELAFYDPLTALPNRRLFMDRLHQALASSGRTNQFGALLLIDLDHFKILNDTRGHNAGDELLSEVARRLRAALRETDSAARLGGDEFAVLLEGLSEHQMSAATIAEAVAEKLRIAIAGPAVVNGKGYRTSPSIGITLFHSAPQEVEALLRQADLALYQAKAAGRNTSRFYSPEMQAAVDGRVEMEAGLRRAIEEGEFELHYQPKVELKRGHVVGAEALIRWKDKSGKLIRPDAFIPLAEETALIVPIGEWVVQTACQQMAAWQRAGLPATRVAINVSARQFQQENLTQVISQALRVNSIEPQWLELELTESAVMASPEKTVTVLQELKNIGVRISLDDFGTGYSSLGHLKRFPIDSLKIDRSFVRDITTDPDDAAIAAMIITLAHSLKQTVIAEGVETEAQLTFLQQQHCDEMQGYFFSRPLPVDEFTALLRNQRRLRTAACAPAAQALHA